MIKKEKSGVLNYLFALFNQKCPRCRDGNMFVNKGAYKFKNFMKMYDNCQVCGQRTEIEKGFYYGTGYVSYALTVAFSVSTFIAWWILIGFSLEDDRLFWWIGINAFCMIILQPYFMRLSRALWLSFFVRYNASWRDEKDLSK